MRRWTRHTIVNISLIVVASLLGLVTWVTSRLPAPIEARSGYLLDSEFQDDLTALRVSDADRHVSLVRLERPQGATRFRVTDSKTTLADPAAVDALLRALESARVVRSVPGADVSLDRMGLEPAQETIEIERHGKWTRLALGAPAPTPVGARYLALSEPGSLRRVLVLDAESAAAIRVAPDDLVDRHLVTWLPSELAHVRLRNRRSDLQLTRQSASDTWFLDGPPRRRASRQVVERLALAATTLSVTQFIASDRDSRDLPRVAELSIELTTRSDPPRRVRLRVGGPCSKELPDQLRVFVDAPKRIGCIKREQLSAFDLSSDALVDRHVFWFHVDEIEGLAADIKAGSLLLERQGSRFRLRKPRAMPVDLDAGNAMLKGLVSAEGELLDHEPGGSARPPKSGLRRVSVWSRVMGESDRSEEAVEVGPVQQDGSRLVQRLDDGAWLRLNRRVAPKFTLDPAQLRSPTLVDVEPESVRQIVIDASGKIQQLDAAPSGSLMLTNPSNLPMDAASAESLREHLARLVADRWLSSDEQLQQSNFNHRTTVRFTWVDADAGSQTHVLKVLDGPGPDVVGQFDDDPALFELNQEWIGLLDGLLVDRSYLRLTDQDDLVRVHMGDRVITLSRDARGWSSSSGGISQDVISQWIERARALRAAAVIGLDASVQPGRSGHGLRRVEFDRSAGSVGSPRRAWTVQGLVPDGSSRLRAVIADGLSVAFLFRDSDIQGLALP